MGENEIDDNWIERALTKNHIKHFEYEHFYDVQEIGSGEYGKVFRVKQRNSEQYFALKSFFKLNKVTVDEIAHELKLQREVDFHENIIRFYGISKFVSESIRPKDYLLVLEYANQGTLKSYLKKNSSTLTWNDKSKLAYQLACAILCLHYEGIIHNDLNSTNILVHQDDIKLADFGLSKRIDETFNIQHRLFGVIPYIDPKKFSGRKDPKQIYKLNEKSDVYSVGVLLWEISSCKPPFSSEPYDLPLAIEISNGKREMIVPNTPSDYVKLYTECWNAEPNKRPTMNKVVARLKEIISGTKINLNPSTIQLPIINTPSYGRNPLLNSPNTQDAHNLTQLMEKFSGMTTDDLRRFESNSSQSSTSTSTSSIYFSVPAEMYTNEIVGYITTSNDIEKDLSTNVDEILKFYLELLNEGKRSPVRKQHVLDYLENNNINEEEIYDWLLKNQNNSNNKFLLGYFNYYKIGTKAKNPEFAFYLFMNANAPAQNHILALYYIGACHLYGCGTIQNEKSAFDCYKIIADKNHAIGQTKLGYFYEKGIGVDKDEKIAVDWYTKGERNGNLLATYDLALCFRYGKGVKIDHKKAFDLYQKAANSVAEAQYDLAEMYENGDGTDQNREAAIEWYTKSSNQGYQEAKVKLKKFSINKKRSDSCNIN